MPELVFKAWLVSNRIKQKDIASLLGISLQSVNKKVNGHEDFTMEQARKICRKYRTSANIFIPDELQ